jgi:hypothetical protein
MGWKGKTELLIAFDMDTEVYSAQGRFIDTLNLTPYGYNIIYTSQYNQLIIQSNSWKTTHWRVSIWWRNVTFSHSTSWPSTAQEYLVISTFYIWFSCHIDWPCCCWHPPRFCSNLGRHCAEETADIGRTHGPSWWVQLPRACFYTNFSEFKWGQHDVFVQHCWMQHISLSFNTILGNIAWCWAGFKYVRKLSSLLTQTWNCLTNSVTRYKEVHQYHFIFVLICRCDSLEWRTSMFRQ